MVFRVCPFLRERHFNIFWLAGPISLREEKPIGRLAPTLNYKEGA